MFKPDFKQWPTTGTLLLAGESSPETQNLETLALQYARKILCENNDRSSSLFDAKTHTDFQFIMPEAKSQWIKIDQIRELIEWSSSTPQIANKKVAVISPAHGLNIAAANALLKTLEESPPNALFILVSDRPTFIPATIRSRCYWIRFRQASKADVDTALQTQLTEDLNVLKTKKNDPISIASQWIKHNPEEILDCLWIIMQDELKSTLLQSGSSNRDLWRFLDKILDAKRELHAPNQPNIQLLMESLLLECA